MDNEERDARKVDALSGPPPDEDLAYDPEMTEADEANIPPESDADPEQADSLRRQPSRLAEADVAAGRAATIGESCRTPRS